MSASSGNPQKTLAALVLAILLATLLINALSAFIRHGEAGLGCADRAACYGLLETATASADVIARRALAPDAPAKRTHRLLATALVVMVLVLVQRSRARRELRGFEARAPLLIAGLLVLLAVIGPASYLKTRPAIATCNLLGGMALAAVSFRMWLGLQAAPPVEASAGLRRLLRAALLALLLQLALGAWTSANYAGLACPALSQCLATVSATDARDLLEAFWYFREIGVDAPGRLDAGNAAAAIHLAHRAGALAAALLLVLAVWRALREGTPAHLALPVVALLATQLAIGVLQLAQALPLAAVLAHSATATLLLLAVLRLHYALRARGSS